MAIQKTEAFVLKAQPFRTSSVVVTAFSRSLGKVKGVAKGVRTEGVIRPSTFEPFTFVELVFYEKIRSELHLISEATLLESFEHLREDLEVLATAYYCAELVDHLTEAHDPHEPIFNLLHFTFRFLPSFSPSFLARFFEVRLLHEVGFLPHLEGCLTCREQNPAKVYFSARQGAIFCQRCRPRSSEARAISPPALEAMRFFMNEGMAEAFRYSLEKETEREMAEVIERFLMEHLSQRLASRQFLNQVRFLKAHPARQKHSSVSIGEAEENQQQEQQANR